MSILSSVQSSVIRPAQALRFTNVVAAVVVAAEVAFILWIPVFVTVDGATHVGGAALIRDLVAGVGDVHLQYVQPAWFPAPNLVPELLLATVMLAVDPTAAEKLLQIAYVIALPAALLYAARGVRRESSWVAVFAIPLTFTFAFHYGFYDFSFGVAAFLVAAGYAWRHRNAPRWQEGLAFGALGLLVYLTHIVAYGELLIFSVSLAGWRIITGRSAHTRHTARGGLRELVPLALGLLPSALLAVAFFAQTETAVPAEFGSFWRQLAGVLSLARGLATFDPLELVISSALSLSLLTLVAIVIWSRRRPVQLRDYDAFLLFALLSGVAAVVAPEEVASGGSFIAERLTLFAAYGVALWLAGGAISDRVAALSSAVWVALALAFLAVRVPTYLDESRTAQDVVSVAPCMATGSVVVQVNLAYTPSGSLGRTDPFLAEAGRLAALTHGHDLGSFEGFYPFFLFQNREANDPFTYLASGDHRPADFQEVPPHLDLSAYNARPDASVDYVMVFGQAKAPAEILGSQEWMALASELARSYRVVGISPRGLVTLFERTDPSLAREGDAQRQAVQSTICRSETAPAGSLRMGRGQRSYD